MEPNLTLTYTNPSMSILYTYSAHWFRVARDTHTYIFVFMSLTVSGSLSGSHIPSLRHHSIVILLCEGRGIRSCVTELLSDIRAVQMDDPSTLAWPTDKKSSLFVQSSPLLSLFLPYPSLKAQLQSFVTPWKKKKQFFPRIPCRAISYSLFWAFPKEQEALWCRHISSVPPLCRFSLFLDNRFLQKAHRTGVPAVYLCAKDKCKTLLL